MGGSLLLKLVFFLFNRLIVLLLHRKQIVARDLYPEISPFVLHEAFEALSDDLMVVDNLGHMIQATLQLL